MELTSNSYVKIFSWCRYKTATGFKKYADMLRILMHCPTLASVTGSSKLNSFTGKTPHNFVSSKYKGNQSVN